MTKLPTLLAILMVISVNGFSEESYNNTKPVIFRTSPANISDSGNSESRLNEEISHTSSVFGPNNATPKKVVSSQGYQLEKIDDSTSDEAQDRSSSNHNTQKASDRQITVWPSASPEDSSSLIDQYLHQEGYDDNSAREELNSNYIPKGKLGYDDFSGKTDISKVRDSFVEKGVSEQKSHQGESYPLSSPLESKYNAEYESPLKYINSPILLKESNFNLNEPAPLSHPHLEHHDEVSGHTAGYGHGFHHHQQRLKAKPLKPSVVYRNPSDSFNHHDKLRTLDKDQLEKGPHQPYGPHHGKGHDYDSYTHGKVIFKPEYYDQTKLPECAHKNKYIYNLTFCLDDPHYPTESIFWALKEEGPHAKKLLSDVTYQSADNLVTGLTRAEEEGYTYKHYFGASHSQNVHLDKYKPPYQGYTYSTDYFKKGGYICPSDIYYARPKRAMNTFGKWKVIINVEHVPDHGYSKYGHGNHHQPHVDIGHGAYGKDHYYHDKHHVHEEDPHHHGKHLAHHENPHHHDGPHHHEGPHHHDKHHESPHHHDKHHPHHEDPHGLDLNTHHEQHGYGDDSYSPHHSIKKREYKEKKSYTQTLRLEQCIYPNAPCSYVDSHYHSKCIQKHNFVRLVAWTHDEGIHVDTFKMPIACSCHVRQPIHFYHESGHHEHKHGHVVPPVNHYHGHQQNHHDEPHGLKKLY